MYNGKIVSVLAVAVDDEGNGGITHLLLEVLELLLLLRLELLDLL